MTTELQDLLAAVKAEHDPKVQGHGYNQCDACRHTRHPCDVYMLCEMVEAEMERLNEALAFGRKAASDATYDRESELAAMARKARYLEAEAREVE